jgi:cytochrome c-type biogenesis protein CcmH/NrfG
MAMCVGMGIAATAGAESAVFDQSTVMVENARLEDAEEMLRQWLGGHEEDVEARFVLARVLTWQGKRTDALSEYTRLLAREPENGDFLEGRARLLAVSASNAPNSTQGDGH